MDKMQIKAALKEELLQKKVFWSSRAPNPDQISDDVLIEKVLLHEDLNNVYRLFDIYPESKVKEVWVNKLVPDLRNVNMNRLYAMILFHIEDADIYLNKLAG